MKISIVVAVYQNEGSLAETHDQIQATFERDLPQHDYELVFVDDGSKDASWRQILELQARDPRVKAITFTRNFGQMAAMLAGFKAATGDAVINISADLQDPVELITQMVQRWEAGAELVICFRASRSDALFARFTSRVAYSVLRMALPQIPRGGFDVVLMDRAVMDTFNAIDVRHRFFQGDLLWGGYRTSFIPYERRERTIGRSQYNFWKRLKNFIDAVLDASYLPIRFITVLGVLTAGFGFFWAVTIVISWIAGDSPFTGWAPLMVAVLVVGGLIMLMLGVIGEYVWRINEEVRKRPNYVVREKRL
ncbi:MAG TPA: glycosyltransferase family 2 protein [Candidatus Limnocylindrales bacterium]|nr:glycosyltransferase family 2 protein [Candidatus Limnocylindrales bacterium]